jgi:hypothetical protein
MHAGIIVPAAGISHAGKAEPVDVLVSRRDKK